MRWMPLLVVLLMAGCSNSPEKADDATSSTSTTAAAGNTTGLAPTAKGPPVISIDGEKDLVVALAGDDTIHRLRVVAFEDFEFSSVAIPGQGGGFGGGGTMSPFGLALFAPEASPLQQAPCSDAAPFPAWDGRVRSGDAGFTGPPGIYDLWLWSGGPTAVTLEINGGGDALNVTAQGHNWTTSVTVPTITKSGPAQTTADFDQVLPMASGGMVLARYVPPNGYLEESMELTIQAAGATCGPGMQVTSGFGMFATQTLLAAAFVGPGETTVLGRYSTTVSPTGEPSGTIVSLQPT